MRVLPAGDGSLLVEVGSVAAASQLYVAVRAAAADAPALRCTDVVPAARTVLFDGVADDGLLRAWLAAWERDRTASGAPGGPEATGGRVVEVPTVYDGADLGDVAVLWDMTRAEVVATHAGTEFVVAFCGFAPGFAYCAGLPSRLAVPRLPSPRPRVPPGSVAVADEFTGVYPTASPGGWRILGRTSLTLWDAAAEEPATLTPGTRVRFVVAEP